jgi:hypothetical protein
MRTLDGRSWEKFNGPADDKKPLVRMVRHQGLEARTRWRDLTFLHEQVGGPGRLTWPVGFGRISGSP